MEKTIVTPEILLHNYRQKDVLIILNAGSGDTWSEGELIGSTVRGNGIAMCEARLDSLEDRYIYALVRVGNKNILTFTFTKKTFYGGHNT